MIGPGATPILARNMGGNEIELTVLERAGLIVISAPHLHNELIMAPGAALELAHQVIELVIKRRAVLRGGPFLSPAREAA
jgi:hypothetical protein